MSITVRETPLWPQPIPVIGVTGDMDSGKTTFGITICPGPLTRVYDTELSSKTYTDLGFDRVDVAAEMLKKHPRGYGAKDVFLWWRDHIRTIKPGQFRVIVLDTASEIESGLTDWVEANPEQFGKTAAQYAKFSSLKWGDVREYWKLLLSDLASRCETFVFTTHTTKIWVDNKPTMKQKPRGKSTLEELASLYLWMERKPDAKGNFPKRPSARIHNKCRLFHHRIDESGEIEITRALPPRLPEATPAAIRKYLLTPPNYDKLKPEERAPEITMSEDDRAELRARTAEAEAEAERLKLERLDRASRPRPAAQPAQPRATPAPTPAPAPKKEAATASNGNGHAKSAAAKRPPTPTEDQLARLKQVRSELFEITEEEDPAGCWERILAKRQVTTAKDLTQEQAEELIMILRAKVTSLQMEAEMARADAGGEADSEEDPAF